MTQRTTTEPESGSPKALSPGGMLVLAALHLGNARTAQLLGIEDRSLRAKLAGERGTDDADLSRLVGDLETRARSIDALVLLLNKRLGRA